MQRLFKFVFISLSLLFAVKGSAQNQIQGDVVVHADPRVDLLFKRKHDMVKTTATPISAVFKTETKNPTATAKPSATPISTVLKTETKNPVAATKHSTAENKRTVAENGRTAPAVAHPVVPVTRAVPMATHREGSKIYSGKGFRVQIYNGQDREKAIKIKTEFMRHFPGVRSYLTYVAPSFRVKVGDYRYRSDAEGMLKEANSMYSPSMIVPDLITISTF